MEEKITKKELPYKATISTLKEIMDKFLQLKKDGEASPDNVYYHSLMLTTLLFLIEKSRYSHRQRSWMIKRINELKGVFEKELNSLITSSLGEHKHDEFHLLKKAPLQYFEKALESLEVV